MSNQRRLPRDGEDMNDRMFADLKPMRLDELTDEAYRRRRSDDLARAFHTDHSLRPSRRLSMSRRPFLFVTAAIGAGLAAAAIVVVPDMVSTSVPGPAASSPSSAQSLSTRNVSARSFLLAAAETVAREPAGSGSYWYTRKRASEPVQNAMTEDGAEFKALHAKFNAKMAELKDKPAELKAAQKEFIDAITKLKEEKLPYKAVVSYTTEHWRAADNDAKDRMNDNQDVKISFATPQEEAKWKEAGSPMLHDDKPETSEMKTMMPVSLDNPSLTLQTVADLPTDKEGLERRLRSLHAESRKKKGSFADDYLPQTGLDLMSAPLTPGTRSALFKVLAEQPNFKSNGQVTDGLGRTGVALTYQSTGPEGKVDFTMTFDPKTADLLEYSFTNVGKSIPEWKVAFEKMGWAEKAGERPQG
ncbi:hypothetical protein [Nonomuraea lactucae]|uniref:hypothetical protein n=1 Tax=Nonomuraea lactucae TaxID=2249762 RepID=UPI000DE1EECC|nr:hypothetical protein [Nonomuraea lactucae]